MQETSKMDIMPLEEHEDKNREDKELGSEVSREQAAGAVAVLRRYFIHQKGGNRRISPDMEEKIFSDLQEMEHLTRGSSHPKAYA